MEYEVVWNGSIHHDTARAEPMPAPPTKIIRPGDTERKLQRLADDRLVVEAIAQCGGEATQAEIKAIVGMTTERVNDILWRMVSRKVIRRCLPVTPGRRAVQQRYANA